ncbi:MAG: hypothetical protein M3O86_01015 [Actinomycetota bacterium]|nr:hypothetical protein [Actinomycetota bacterium]
MTARHARAGRMLRRLAVALGALALLAGLTVASVLLITPDVAQGPCDRVDLISPTPCSPIAPVQPRTGSAGAGDS